MGQAEAICQQCGYKVKGELNARFTGNVVLTGFVADEMNQHHYTCQVGNEGRDQPQRGHNRFMINFDSASMGISIRRDGNTNVLYIKEFNDLSNDRDGRSNEIELVTQFCQLAK